jgi:hypothetical protein
MIVTDENDCSIFDGGQGFYPLESSPTGASVVSHGTSTCETNPNDPCCFNCGRTDPPPGCMPPKDDPACKRPAATISEDAPNLRCFNQKKKYGQDFLYPVQRYIDGFGKTKIRKRNGEVTDNPLFSDLTCKQGTACQPVRDESLVFVAGITGVPWQLIAKNPNDLKAGYKSAKDIQAENLWADLVGDPDNPNGPVLPRSRHMVESIVPRDGLAPPTSGATADPLHGHEWDPSQAPQPNSDLQYACTFKLKDPKPCLTGQDCDCFAPPSQPDQLEKMKNPLCQDEATGRFTNKQVRAKAYPGTRILQVLQGLDPEQAIVASICPARVDNPGEKDYGYTPAIQALISRLRTVLRGRCMPRALEVDPESGHVPCVVIEAYNSTEACECRTRSGRIDADKELITPAMREVGNCFCEIEQLKTAQAQDVCKTNIDPGDTAGSGWCYIDPAHGKDGQPDKRQCGLVAKCPATERRLIKFVNTASEPRPGATAFIMCQEKAFDPAAGETAADVCAAN